MKLLFSPKNKKGSFAAFCTSLGATLGTGNIIGACTALFSGGAGAVFWMWVAAFFGMAVKYFESYWAVKTKRNGSGGPFYYMEAMGGFFAKAAPFFAAACAAGALFGIGTVTQAGSAYLSARGAFGDKASLAVLFSVLFAALSAAVIFRGEGTIKKASSLLVPVMALVYLSVCAAVLVKNAPAIPGAFLRIFKEAFTGRTAFGGAALGRSALGGLSGAAVRETVRTGVSRGIFANEAGLGSSPIAAASSGEENAEKQGLVMMASPVFDTFTVCTLTSLCAVVTGAADSGASGADMAIRFLSSLFGTEKTAGAFLFLCILLFSFTSVIGWNYYGRVCAGYLVSRKYGREKEKNLTKRRKKTAAAIFIYNVLYVIIIMLSPFVTPDIAWCTADIFNGIMTVLNLSALTARLFGPQAVR